MVKLYVLSDLHLEYCPFVPDARALSACDVVVLAGDIHPGDQGISWARQAFADKPVVYVAGNHELYGGHWQRTLDDMRQAARTHDVHFLENEAVHLAGIRFLGCTLWSDFAYYGAARQASSMRLAERGVADYSAIEVQAPGTPEALLKAGDTLARHQASRTWLERELLGAGGQADHADRDRTVVVTHHYPRKRSTAKEFSNDALTPAFGSILPAGLVLGAGLWIHGHTHSSANYGLGDSRRRTRVVCNPRGYPLAWLDNEMENAAFDPALVLHQHGGRWAVASGTGPA